MPTLTAETQETERLAQTLAVIQRRIERLTKERGKSAKELVTYRKYMWEDAAFFDRAERVQTENVALTQEQAVMDVGVRLKRMNLLSASPYFGRIDFHESGVGDAAPVYIGLYGLVGDDQAFLVHDWRAPIAGMFYDCEVGPAQYVCPEGTITGDMTLKRQYKIENGHMVYMLDSSLAINDEILRDALARNTSEKMRQIVNSIQKEQNAVIRDEARKVLVVQGPAGSGKTSIAMHRAAWLLYRHRGHISANNLLVFSPSEVFADYISNVLPELGEENIREATFEDYARSMLGKKVGFEPKAEQMEYLLTNPDKRKPMLREAFSPEAAACSQAAAAAGLCFGAKSRPKHSPKHSPSDYAIRTASIAFKSSRAFLNIIRNYERHLRHTALRFEDIKINEVRLLPAATVEELYWEHCADLPIMAGITRLKDRVLSRCTYSSTLVERKIEGLVDKILIDRDPVRLYRKLFADFHLVKQLSDEGDVLPENLHAICKHTYKSLHVRRVPYEDVAPIILLKRLIDGEPRYANVRHLIIDEAQDYTPIHFEIIHQLFGESSMTILGDLSQRINPYSGLDSYDVLGDILGKDARGIAELTKSYRSSWEISEFAKSILPTAITAENVRRSGRKPTIVRADQPDQVPTLISDEITRLQSEGMVSIAVICKTAHEASGIYSKLLPDHDIRLVEADSITFHHGSTVLPIYLAKGLEFDAVIIHDAGRDTYGSETERKLLYTACTRALHSLTLYYAGELSPLVVGEGNGLWEERL